MIYLLLPIYVWIITTDIYHRKVTNLQCVMVLLIVSLLTVVFNQPFYISTALLALLFSFVLFCLNIWGGGDGKLFIASSPLFTLQEGLSLITIMLFCGGILAIGFLIRRWIFASHNSDRGLPYSLAIIAGVVIQVLITK